MGSYPTYEEWKHTIGVTTKIIIIVLILPMRNGNPFFTYVAIVSAVFVLILPMRNGNTQHSHRSLVALLKFLSYL